MKAPEECGNLYEESFELAGEELREMESIAVLSDQLPSPSDQVSREAILKDSAIDGREWLFEVEPFFIFRKINLLMLRLAAPTFQRTMGSLRLLRRLTFSG